MLFASAGMSLLAVSAELIPVFVNIEVLSIGSYARTSYLRRGTRPSVAGFMYVILGAFSTGALLAAGAIFTAAYLQMGRGQSDVDFVPWNELDDDDDVSWMGELFS
jgi:NADH:ubiquinone oxidoreductase subunit 2 (subunit N)